MGQSRERIDGNGRARWTAYYTDVTGKRRSAGTFGTERQADRAWQRAEAKVAEGGMPDLRLGKQRFGRYVTETWFPNHRIELTTRQNYTYLLERYILPEFGGYHLNAILPGTVRAWTIRLEEEGVKASTIKNCLSIMSAIFTTALNDRLVALHACKGVKPPKITSKARRIITPEQFDTIHEQVGTPELRLLVETDVETGLRWGELTELRKHDVDWKTGVLIVSRTVVELTRRFAPDGCPFVVKQYPKDDEWRRITLSKHIHELLLPHVENLADDDLLFRAPEQVVARRRVRPEVLLDPETLGLTELNAEGKQYRHGTATAYGMAPCHCQHCRAAVAAYRAERRANGLDNPRTPRTLDTDGHIPRNWFRTSVWLPALTAAGLPFRVRIYDLRHAHASWLLAGGADLATVKERMGHRRLTTTEVYLHSLPHADAAAVVAIDSIRGRKTG